MPTTATRDDEATEQTEVGPPRPGVRSSSVGLAWCAVGIGGLIVWLTWRVTHLRWNPVSLAFLAAELGGLIGAVAVSSGLAASRPARDVFESEPRDSHWFAHAVADLVGRTRADDLHQTVRTSVRAAPRLRWRDSADAAIFAVLLDGPRRLLMITAVVTGLLLGVSPFGAPPWWAISGLAAGVAGLSASHVSLGRGRIRVGDRIRWTYGAIGEIVVRRDVEGLAPRRWVGAIGAAVGLSVAIALRGLSDRWTHGLPAMSDDDRVVLLAIAVSLVLGALYTINTTPRPMQADAHLVARHLEERTARQSLLAVAVLVGMVGLVAGLLPTEHAAPAPPVATARAEVADG